MVIRKACGVVSSSVVYETTTLKFFTWKGLCRDKTFEKACQAGTSKREQPINNTSYKYGRAREREQRRSRVSLALDCITFCSLLHSVPVTCFRTFLHSVLRLLLVRQIFRSLWGREEKIASEETLPPVVFVVVLVGVASVVAQDLFAVDADADADALEWV